jgi:hypothetical protein
MRTTKLLITLIVASLTAFTMGCGKQEGNSGSGLVFQPNGPFVPGPGTVGPGANPGSYDGINWEYGGTGTLSVSPIALAQYVGTNQPITATPGSLRINLNLKHFPGQMGSKASYHSYANEVFDGYGGVVTIAFKTTSGNFEDSFSSLVNPNGMVKTDAENNKYNIWRQVGDSWVGFFQDYYGSIIVIIDDVDDFGDGASTTANGKIYFKNHPEVPGPLSPTSCWFVVTGPYDCRTWKSGKRVDVNAALYPNGSDGYTLLGSFTGINVNKAFNSLIY